MINDAACNTTNILQYEITAGWFMNINMKIDRDEKK